MATDAVHAMSMRGLRKDCDVAAHIADERGGSFEGVYHQSLGAHVAVFQRRGMAHQSAAIVRVAGSPHQLLVV